MVDVTVSDGAESLKVVFFNQAWRERQLTLGVQALFFGKVSDYRGQRQMTNPVVDVIVGASGEERDASKVGRVVAIYPASGKAGLTSWEMGGFIEESLRRAGPLFDPLAQTDREPLGLVDRTRAYWGIHLPDDVADTGRPVDASPSMSSSDSSCCSRCAANASKRPRRASVTPSMLADLDVEPGALRRGVRLARAAVSRGHRFALTCAQRRVLEEIARDMASPLPMHRLLQGDVGFGQDDGRAHGDAGLARRRATGGPYGAYRGARRTARRLAASRSRRA